MTVPARVNLVTLGVSDLDRETRFYQALGWRLSGSSVSGEVSFFDLSNVVLTPHIGAVTREANTRSRAMPVDNIIAYLEGRPQHVVNGVVSRES